MGPFVLIIVLLAVNGFFVALEFALVGSRRSRLEPLAAAGDRSAQRALASMSDLSIQLAGAQLGITIASLGLGVVGEPAVAHLFESGAENISWLEGAWVRPVMGVIALLIVVFLHMVVGEMVPKSLTLTHPEAVLRRVTIPNRIYLFVFRPVLVVLNALGNLGVRLFGVEPRDEITSAHTVEELAALVTVSHDEGAIPDRAADLLAGVLDFAGRDVETVIVHRDTICAVPATATLRQVESVIREHGHTRVPVVGEHDLDDIVGFIHSKDLIALDDAELDAPIPSRLVRQTLTVARTASLEELLVRMQTRRVHLAVIVDDDESTAGIVTLDDLLDALVGEIAEIESDR